MKRQLSLIIVELTTELGEQLYDYSAVSYSDLIFVKSGKIRSYLEIDQTAAFTCYSEVILC